MYLETGDLTTEIDIYIIEMVKKMRHKRNMSQIALSQRIGMSSSFVSHVESAKRRAKYNVNHLNEIAKVFDCSPKDFWPEKPI